MATSSESLHQNDSIGSEESLSKCANTMDLSNNVNEAAQTAVATDAAADAKTELNDIQRVGDAAGNANGGGDNEGDGDAEQSPQLQAHHHNFSPDEIPEPIKVLDDIISEFEETSKPPLHVAANGENQSEDDGYMSLSRKNMHKRDFEENVSQSSIGSNAVTHVAGTPTKEFHEFNSADVANTTDTMEPTAVDQNIIQSTLPKTRPASALTSNYSSLPCCGVRSSSVDSKTRGVSCNGERNILGIDISAVHNAVLRGGLAKIPEPIVNEHPVTIYPGRYSPPTECKRNNRPQRLLSSVEKHKEVCHILNPLSSISSSSSSSSSSNSTGLIDGKSTDMSHNMLKKPYMRRDNEHKFRLVSEDDFSDDSIEEQSLSPITTQCSPQKQAGIAWEIHFKSNRKKSKAVAKKKPPRKHATDCAVKIENGGLPMSLNEGSHLHMNNDLACRRDHSMVIDVFDGPDQCSPPSADILNYCMYRHNTNMLGKGTFIIRRVTKKPPKAMDIFRNETNHAEISPTDFNDHTDFSSIESSDACIPSEVLSTSSRHSLELIAAAQGAPLASPRERLSLNLEPQLPNVYVKESSVVHKSNRASSEEFIAPIKSKMLLKKDAKKHSTDSTNTKSSSFEDTEDPEVSEASDLNVSSNHFDACNVYAYKNESAGCMKQDFPDMRSSNATTPHTDLAPTLEEEEEQYSDFSYSAAPLKQIEKIESNISALLRGEISMVRVGDGAQPKRPLEFRPGVHKSESAKEMLLSQNAFGPLPPSPPSSNPDIFDYDALPLPPSPKENIGTLDEARSHTKGFKKTTTTAVEIHTPSLSDERRSRDNCGALRYLSNELPPLPPPAFENVPPAVPPHRSGHSANTMKSWSIDSNYKKKSPKMLGYGSGITTPTGSQCEGSYSTKRYVSYGTKRSLKQSPREELRLQTSCSLPETPIFARGSCDIPRTPFRRQNESAISGSRTAPRSSTSHSINMGNSIVGIVGGNTFGAGMCRQRSMNHALASNEMLRMAGAPARGWYPKQRSMRPASTENIDRLSAVRVWDSAAGMSGTGQSRKPLTLPPNLTPSFLNKSPREALRRVTSLLIAKKKNTKERKSNKPFVESTLDNNLASFDLDSGTGTTTKENSHSLHNTSQKPQKKKGLFKSLWKRTKHFSLDQ